MTDTLQTENRPAILVDGGSVERRPGTLRWTPVFAGTRVPVRILFEYLAGGDDLDEFLDCFPGVRREQAVAVLEHTRELYLATLDDPSE